IRQGSKQRPPDRIYDPFLQQAGRSRAGAHLDEAPVGSSRTDSNDQGPRPDRSRATVLGRSSLGFLAVLGGRRKDKTRGRFDYRETGNRWSRQRAEGRDNRSQIGQGIQSAQPP